MPLTPFNVSGHYVVEILKFSALCHVPPDLTPYDGCEHSERVTNLKNSLLLLAENPSPRIKD